MLSQSARTTEEYQTLACSARVTSPASVAPGATQAPSRTVGFVPFSSIERIRSSVTDAGVSAPTYTPVTDDGTARCRVTECVENQPRASTEPFGESA
ncbi:hypothetical protein GCM10027444_01990 [Actinopolyspora lacussalsi]